MKNVSTFAIACVATASLFSMTASTWPTMQVSPQSVSVEQVVPDAKLSETPAAADKFVDSIGADAKYENGYPALVTQQLEASGIRHIRDSAIAQQPFINEMKVLGQHGIKHSIGVGQGFSANDLRSRMNVFMPYVDFIEPANEADNVAKPNWNQMRSDQKNLWNTIRANRNWNGVAIAGPSFADPKEHAPLVGPLDQYQDFGQLHNGTCNWNPGSSVVYVSIDVNTGYIRKTTTYKPIETTESGFSDNLARGCSLTDNLIAKYVPRITTERWLHGEPRTYINVLADNPKDAIFGHLGLLHANGTSKPQFVALSSLIHLLADPGSAPKSTKVSYTISNATSDVHHILLARRDGSYDLLIYREMPCWDHYKNAPISVSSENVSLAIPGVKHSVLYKYNSSYGFSSSTLAINKATVRFPVTDSIAVLHFGF